MSVIAPAPWTPPRPQSTWSTGRILGLVFGVLLVLGAAVMVIGGGVLRVVDNSAREDGYLTSEETDLSTTGFALAADEVDLDDLPGSWALGDTRVRVTAADPDTSVFIGLARPADAAAYLDGVDHATVTDLDDPRYDHHSGNSPADDPAESDIWVAQETGPGAQAVSWPDHGRWTLVVMNSDGSAGVDVGAEAQVEAPHLGQVALGVLVAGLVSAPLGGALLWRTLRRRPQA
jgi:hypothetical protein